MKKLLTSLLVVVMIFCLTACGKPSVEEFASSEAVQSEIAELKSSLSGSGMDISVTGEGDKLIYTFTLAEGTDTTGLEEGLKAGVEAQASTFEGLAAELKGAVSAENPVVVVIYATSDGTEIYSQEFTAK
ncbi:Uncharacterised protein [uncultured Ruminococcus sp.]|uniref:DUF4854 domain-containing protein n=1 Tax=Massiliimalia timonensis TaxID=1987501 RepID=A0A8J6PHX9_9FIRM|nr:DUF4854 domain-containing protein [Massiliimalia timonensis]MBC8610370.1 DUF4854 domain-containing protein [Massiliimalia timonensis]MBS7175153.1 DUF4854 domain-containing protein [Clostridiales bacterium]SCH63896.1 Uncharacterised protein [uncultured Clostridium sp.]SCH78697.1 Uncharacterised protein [uncultured Ruminococcus sp.]